VWIKERAMVETGESSSQRLDPGTIAFHRLLKDAASEEQTRVDALVVLSQRTIFAATWPGTQIDIRTLTNSQGETAMPLFTAYPLMADSAKRYGWYSPDGTLQWQEMGAREALRQAVARSVHFVVIDIGSEHSVEFTKEEIEPLLRIRDGVLETGPYAAAGRISSSLMQAVKRKLSVTPTGTPQETSPTPIHMPAPPPVPAVKPPVIGQPESRIETPGNRPQNQAPQTSRPSSQATGPVAVASKPITQPASNQHSKAIPDPANLVLSPLDTPLNDDLFDALSEMLRQFPEVEWANVLLGKNEEMHMTLIGLRLDPSFTTRAPEIEERVQRLASQQGVSLHVLLLDDLEKAREIRSIGTVFFPWRK